MVSTKYYSDLESAASDCHRRPRGSRDTRRHRLAQVSVREKDLLIKGELLFLLSLTFLFISQIKFN